MVLDSARHRKILLEILNDMQLPGRHLDELYELKQAIKKAEIYGKPDITDESTP